MIERIRQHVTWVPLLVAIGILLFCLLPAGRTPTGDAPHLLGISERLAHEFTHLEWGTFGGHWLNLVAPHPPVGYLLPTAAYALGFASLTPLLCAVVSLVLIWRGMLLLTRADERSPPWLALLLLLACPLFWLSFSELHWDLLAAAALAMPVGHLAASDGLQNTAHTRAFGAWMGVGFLTKYSFPAFAFFPVLLIAPGVVLQKRFRGLANALGCFALLAGPWLLLRGGEVLPYVLDSLNSESHLVDRASISAVVDPAYYLVVLKNALGWPGLLLLSTGLFAARSSSGRIALSAGLGGILILSKMGQQEPRYILPALPMLAVSVHCAFDALRGRPKWASWAIALAVLLPMLSFSAGANRLGAEVPAERRHEHHRTSLKRWGDWPRVHTSFLPVSSHTDAFGIDKALEAMASHRTPEDGNTVGLMLDNTAGELRDALFFHRASRLGLWWDFVSLAPPPGGHGREFGKFKGPFRSKGEAPSRFRILYAAYKRGDRAREAWLQSNGAEVLTRIRLPNGFQGEVIRLQTWVETDVEREP